MLFRSLPGSHRACSDRRLPRKRHRQEPEKPDETLEVARERHLKVPDFGFELCACARQLTKYFIFLDPLHVADSGGIMTAQDATAPQQLLLPDMYSGNGDFAPWVTHFSACAVANSWSDDQKLVVLPTLLRRRTQRICDHFALTGEKKKENKLIHGSARP